MANIINTTSVSQALVHRSNQDLSGQHITTSDFMQTQVARCLHLVPKQSIELSHMCFSRLEPMPVPTFGRAEIHHNAFFVPYRTIFPAWNDFINDTPHVYSDSHIEIPYTAPFISCVDLCELFVNNESLAVGNQDTPDFELIHNDQGNVVGTYYKFTPRGRRYFKILLQLGYRWYWNTSAEFIDTIEDEQYYSLLPLFSLLKIFKDYYIPSQYANSDRYASAMRWLSVDLSSETFEWNVNFGERDLLEILDVVDYVYYSGDYFTNVFDNPSSPNGGLQTTTYIDDITLENNHRAYISSNPSDEPTPSLRAGVYQGYSRITQYALTALRSMTDYMKRHQLAGSRALERYLSRFGVTLSVEKLNRCIKVNSWKQDIQFGDVTSTSDTDGASLGAFAGKGVSYGNGTFDFSTDEYGCFLVISTIVPKISYYQGLDRNVKHINKDDFWTPEYDNLGVQAMSTSEVFIPMLDGPWSSTDPASMIFGFVPRYAEYKVGRDLISGDYIMDSMNVGKDSWTLFRDVSGYFNSANGGLSRSHSLNFLRGDYNQYDRIFYNQDNTTDKFNIVHDFKIKSSFPGKSLYDTYEFESEEYGAKSVTVDVGGAKVN